MRVEKALPYLQPVKTLEDKSQFSDVTESIKGIGPGSGFAIAVIFEKIMV